MWKLKRKRILCTGRRLGKVLILFSYDQPNELMVEKRFTQQLIYMSKVSMFQLENEIPWEDLGEGVARKICGYDDKIMLVKVKFEAGAIGPLHEHYHSQVTYVDSGVFETSVNGITQLLKAGDCFYALPHQIHGVLCIEAGILIDVFSPMRGDFLNNENSG